MQRFETPEGVPCYVLFAGEEFDPNNIPEQLCYVFGKGGYYIYRKNNLYNAVVSTKECEMFGDVKEAHQLTVHKIPYELFRRVVTFFADVYKKHKSEVAVLLYYNFETKEWIWTIPNQTVSAASVHYDEAKGRTIIGMDGNAVETMPEGYSIMGSIHSHASMGAFHSGTDTNDEFKFDGIHITIGSFQDASQTFSARWMISSREVKAEMADIIQGMPSFAYPEADAMKQVSAGTVVVTGYRGGACGYGVGDDGEIEDYRQRFSHGGAAGHAASFPNQPWQGGQGGKASGAGSATVGSPSAGVAGTTVAGEKKTSGAAIPVPGVVVYHHPH